MKPALQTKLDQFLEKEKEDGRFEIELVSTSEQSAHGHDVVIVCFGQSTRDRSCSYAYLVKEEGDPIYLGYGLVRESGPFPHNDYQQKIVSVEKFSPEAEGKVRIRLLRARGGEPIEKTVAL